MPVDPDGWDLDVVGAAVRQVQPRLAYLIPDFQNPTGHVMTEPQRRDYARHLKRGQVIAVVDEAHQALALEGQEMPAPFAAFAPDAITIGSASKTFWGGLRLGWIRAPRGRMDELTRARVGLDLGAPVMEQLVLARLLADADTIARASTGAGCASSATGWPQRSPSTCRSGASGCPPAGWRCGASCRPPSAPRSPTRPTGSA